MFNASMDANSIEALKEKIAVFKANPAALEEAVATYFTQFDKDNNGHLDRKELRLFLTAFYDAQKIKLPLTDEYIDATFRELDADKSNSIEVGELQAYAKALVDNLGQQFE